MRCHRLIAVVHDEGDNKARIIVEEFPIEFHIGGTDIRPTGNSCAGESEVRFRITWVTDRNNVLRILSFDQIKAIVEPTIGKVKGYGTFEVPAGKARNSRYFIDQTIDTTIAGKVTKKPKIVKKEAASMMHFTVVPDEPERQIITPIHFVEVKHG